MAYVPLHVHTEHSALDGMARLKTMFSRCAELGMTASAVTDHGSLNGLWKSAQMASKAGLKFVPGMEAYMAIGSRHQQNSVDIERDDEDGMGDADDGSDTTLKVKRYEHLTLLARNRTGWHNLIRFHNDAQLSYWYKPRGDYELLAQHGEGLMVLTGCLAGPVAGPLARAARAERTGDTDQADRLRAEARQGLAAIIEAVGEEHVFLEVMDHGIGAEEDALHEIYALAEETGLPLVATNDSHYQDEHEAHVHDGFLCVGTGAKIEQPNRFAFNGSGYHIRSESEMLALRPDDELWAEAVHNSGRVAEMVEADTVPPPVMRLPEFPVPDGYADQSAYLRHLVAEGLQSRYGAEGAQTEAVQTRIEDELGVIERMGFPSYFLIMHDLLAWCRSDAAVVFDNAQAPRKAPIIVGLGRGSAAGSLVSYALDIVGVDPLENGLLFERFLEEGREGLPDIDTDFPASRRAEVFAYLQYRWGRANCARIGQYGVAKTKAAIKDAARILKPWVAPDAPADARRALEDQGREVTRIGDRLAELVPQEGEKPFTFDKLDSEDRRADPFWDFYAENEQVADQILELARGFEDTAKSPGIHPCGFIVSPEPLSDIVPLRLASNAKDADPDAPMVICWDGADCDEFGLLKLDILGLMNLDIVQTALENIALNTDEVIGFEDIPDPGTDTDDVRAAWELFDAGSTGGIFQAESDGMTRMIQSFIPRSLADVSVAVAAYRPGPMAANVPQEYADRKHGRKAVDYSYLTDDPEEQRWIDTVLGETQGLLVYQEQAMQLGAVLSGFDASQRSLLRRAIGKKKADAMAQVGELLMAGAGRQFHDETGTLTSPVFAESTVARAYEMMKGAASYAFNKSHSVAYGYLAYITAYLKARWPVEYSAAILAVADKDDKRAAALKSLTRARIEVRAPDVNASRAFTSPVGDSVVLGLGEIKDVGTSVARAIVAEREARGEFTDLHDMLSRVGVPDKSGKTGSVDVGSVVGLIEAGALDRFGPRMGLMMIARASKSHRIDVPQLEWDPAYRSARERHRLGINLGSNALDDLAAELDRWANGPDAELRATQERRTEDHWGRSRVNVESFVPQRLADPEDSSHRKVFAVVGEWNERSSRSGRMARMVLVDGFEQMDAIIFPRDFKELTGSGYTPEVGDVVCVSGEVRTREIAGDDDTEESETRKVQEMIVSRLRQVHTPVATPIPAGIVEAAPASAVAVDEDVSEHEAPAEDPGEPDTPPSVIVTRESNAELMILNVVFGPVPQCPVDLSGICLDDMALVRHRRLRYVVILDESGAYDDASHARRGERAVAGWDDPTSWTPMTVKRSNRQVVPTDFELYTGPGAGEEQEQVEQAPVPAADERPVWVLAECADGELLLVHGEVPDEYTPDLSVFAEYGEGSVLYVPEPHAHVIVGVFEDPESEDSMDEMRAAVAGLETGYGWLFKTPGDPMTLGIWSGAE